MAPTHNDPHAHGQPLSHWARAVQHSSPAIRERAAEVLAELGPAARPAADAVLRTFTRPGEHSRPWLARALGRLGPPLPEAVAALRQVLFDDDSDLAFRAAEALARLGEAAPQGLPALVAALQSPHLEIRNDAATALVLVGEAAIRDLVHLADPPPDVVVGRDVRELAVQALGRIGPAAAGAGAVLIRLCQDDDPRVRHAAVRAVGLVRLPGPTVCTVLRQALTGDEEAQRAACDALAAYGPAIRENIGDIHERLLGAAEDACAYCRSFGDLARQYGGWARYETLARALVDVLRPDPDALAEVARRVLFDPAFDAHFRGFFASALGRHKEAVAAGSVALLEALWAPNNFVRSQVASALAAGDDRIWGTVSSALRVPPREDGWEPANLRRFFQVTARPREALSAWIDLLPLDSMAPLGPGQDCENLAWTGYPDTMERPDFLRFELGEPWKIGTGRRIRQVVDRATALYEATFRPDDYLLLVAVGGYGICGQSPGYLQSLIDAAALTEVNAPSEVSWAWSARVAASALDHRRLLAGIANAEQGRYPKVAERVYVVCPRRRLCFHMYDDRGLWITGWDKDLLRAIEKRFGHWDVRGSGLPRRLEGGRRPLLKGLRSKHAAIREAAAWGLADAERPTRQGFGHLIRLLRDCSRRVRRQAAFTLGVIGKKHAAGPLTELLGDDDPGVRAWAVAALAEIAPDCPTITARVVAALRDPSPEVRAEATEGLGQRPATAESLAALREALQDTDWHVRCRAAEALYDLGEAAASTADALALAANDPVPTVRHLALESLARVQPGASQYLAAFRQALNDPDENVRNVGLHALAMIGPAAAEAVGDIAPLLADEGGGIRHVGESAARALGALGPGAVAAVGPLRDAVRRRLDWLAAQRAAGDTTHYHLGAAIESIKALGKVGPAAVPVLLEMAGWDDQDSGLHLHLSEAFGQIGLPASGALPYLELWAEEGDQALSLEAHDAWRKIVLGQPGEVPGGTAIQGLLEAVARGPEDDMAWQAYADCLEELGQGERAVLVRSRRAGRNAASQGNSG